MHALPLTGYECGKDSEIINAIVIAPVLMVVLATDERSKLELKLPLFYLFYLLRIFLRL